MSDFLHLGPTTGPILLLAHGAGAPMDSGWMTDFCTRLAQRGVRTARFEFAYMAARRQGQRKPPPKAEKLMDEYCEAVAGLAAPDGLVIGGKSMGGRVASLVADEVFAAGAISGLVCLGYPFHPLGQPEKLRTAHLEALQTPALICHGTRDPFGMRDEVATYRLPPAISLHWLEDGDHDFRPRKAISGLSHAQNLDGAAEAAALWIASLPRR